MNKFVTTLLMAFCLLAGSLQVVAQTDTPEALPEDVPGLLIQANEAYVAKDYLTFRKVLEKLHLKRPYNSEYMYQLVIAHAILGEKTPAYDMMVGMQQQGLSYDFTKTEATRSIRGTEVFDFVNDMMIMAGEPLGESEKAFTLPQGVVLPETIAWDESRQKFLVGTVADGSIFAVGMDGQATELIKANDENGMWSVFDILVDQARDRLWVSSAASPVFSGLDAVDKGRSALFEFDLKTLELVNRYPVPVDGRPHVLGSMALAPNGDIYIVDRVLPLVFRKAADEQKLEAVLASKEMVSMRGIALQPDGNIMYLADREMGILVVDIRSGGSMKLAAQPTLNLGGIDGLYLWQNSLVIIQNGIKPQRVMRLGLDATGTKVGSVRPLAVAQPEFNFPSFGTLKGEDLYFFAGSQTSANRGPAKGVTVLRTAVNSSKELVGPDMESYLEERGKKQEALRKAAQEEAAKQENAEKDKSEDS